MLRCFDDQLLRNVAYKRARRDTLKVRPLMLGEARLLAYLDHPGVVQVFDVLDGGAAYTMQVLEGESLQERLARQRAAGERMPLSEVKRILVRICETMANAHQKGVLHLDLKPANLQLGTHGRVSVLDWGVARFHDTEPYAQHLRAGGHPVELPSEIPAGGTPAYMPVEQLTGGAVVPASDVFAVGTIVYEMLAGALPYPPAKSLAALTLSKVRTRPRPLRQLRPELPEALLTLCERMLAVSSEDRPRDFEAVGAVLAALSDVGSGGALVTLAPDELLFEQGEVGDRAYQIVEGQLEVLVREQRVAVRGPGDIVGELALISHRPRTATLRALEPVVLRAVDWAAVEAELAKVDPMVGRLLRSVSAKLVEESGG